MAEQHGGYRRPANPAPVSNPGAGSQRTDGRPGEQPMRDLPNAKYGEAAQFTDVQAGAPMAGGASPVPSAVPLGAPTQRPDEPVTAGNPLGAGPGPQAAGIEMRTMDEQDAQALKSQLPMLEYMANMPNSAPSLRAIVRRLKGNL